MTPVYVDGELYGAFDIGVPITEVSAPVQDIVFTHLITIIAIFLICVCVCVCVLMVSLRRDSVTLSINRLIFFKHS
jgi:hypothetical protein